MKRLLKSALAVALCLSMTVGTCVPLNADTYYSDPEVHEHDHGETIATASAPEVREAAITETPSHVIKTENGITITAVIDNKYVSAITYMCQAPELQFSSSVGDITSVKVQTRTYDYNLHNYKTEDYNDGTPNIPESSPTATYTFGGGARGSYIVTVTAGESATASVTLTVEHTIGGRDVIDFPATCTQPERHQQVYYCKTCSGISHTVYSVVKDKGPTGHDYGDEIITVTTDKNCEGKEIKYKKCKNCGHIEYADGGEYSIDKEQHDFTVTETAKTSCTSDGTTITKCSKCDVYDIDSQKTVDPVPHNMQSWAEAEAAGGRKPATCEGYGTFVRKCKNEGCTYTSTTTYAPTGHKWEVEEVIKEATCQHEGRQKVKCSVCNTEETQTIPKTGHNYQVVEEKAPSCTEEGYYVMKCIVKGCDAVMGDPVPIDKLPHTPETVTDCTKDVKCTVCGNVITEGNASHNFGGAYVNNGSTHYQNCTNKNCLEHSDPEPHVPDIYTNNCTGSFTCKICKKTANGNPTHTFKVVRTNALYHFLKCENCATEQNLLHSFRANDTNFTILDDGDCTTPVVCTYEGCGYIGVQAYAEHEYTEYFPIPNDPDHHEANCIHPKCTQAKEPEPHTFVEIGRTAIDPETCTKEGTYTVYYECVCKATKTEIVTVPAAQHNFSEWEEKDNVCTGTIRTRKCQDCNYVETETTGFGEHTTGETVTVPATCSTDGSETVYCSVCREAISSETIPATGKHEYSEVLSVIDPPNCVTSGATVYKCKYCDSEWLEEIKAPGHKFGEYTYNNDATCQKAGTMTASCTVDGCEAKDTIADPNNPRQEHKFTNYVYQNNATIDHNATEIAECDFGCGTKDEREVEGTQLHEHTFLHYDTLISPATCDTPAVYQATCEVCHEATDTMDVGEPLGHSESAVQVVVEATCTADAVGMTICTRCEKTMRDNIAMPGTAQGHQWGEFVYNNDATTETDGTETAHCTRCDETYTRTKPGTKLEGAHVFKNYVYNNDATCTNGTETAYCENGCGSTDTREAVGTALGHSLSAPKVVKAATCTDDEVTEATCERCGTVVSGTNAGTALGHDLSLSIVAPATCTQNATGEYRCSRCEYVSETTTIEGSMTGHLFGEWITETGSTCVAEGTMYRECSVCKLREYSADPADGHVWDSDFTIDVEPTCDRDGSKSIHCLNCDVTKEETVIPRREHVFVVTDTLDATCTADGLITKTCSYPDCQYQEHTTIPATGHSYGEPVLHSGASCTDNDYTVTTCTKCGNEVVNEIADSARGHVSDEGTVTKMPTATEAGERTYKCTVCGETIRTETIPPLSLSTEITGDNASSASVDPGNLLSAVVTEDELKKLEAGEKLTVILEVSDGSDTVTDEQVDLAEKAADNKDLEIAVYYEIDLFKKIGTSETRITSTNEPVYITLEIPAEFRKSNRQFSLISIRDSEAAIVLEDRDSDPATITVATDHFSPYVLAFKDVKPSTHQHVFTYGSNAQGHWVFCPACGAQLSPITPHQFDYNGTCVCGYRAPVSGGGVSAPAPSAPSAPAESTTDSVEVNVPTEGKLNDEE